MEGQSHPKVQEFPKVSKEGILGQKEANIDV